MSEAENRSTSNLILLCLEHASEVDEHDRVAEFPVSLLREWKRGQLEDFDRLGHGGWNLSDAEVREVIESSFAPSFDLRGSVIRLGGDGGRAPAAGGGGGGVLGAFAAAGAGGKGGDLTLDGSPGEAPGAGGGGAGAVGPAVGGEGGGGGEYVKRWFSADELPDVVEVKVGRGGQGVKGGDGLDGENTSFGELVAQGGRGGRAGRMGEPVHQAGDHSAIRVSSAFFANAAELRDGLFHVRGGGWSTYTVRTLPGVLSGCVVLMLEVDSPPPMVRYDVRFELVSPGGDVKGAVPITPTIDVPEQVTRVPWLVFLKTEVDVPGIWVARMSAGDHELTRLPIEVKAA